jgi:peroxiredoxin
MKRLGIAFCALTILTGAANAFAQGGKAIPLGAKAPMADTKMKSATDGKDVTLASVAGKKGTLAVFTCNDCPFAKAWEDRIVALGNSYAKKGVGVVLINANNPGLSKSDTFEEMQKRAKERGMTFAYAVDNNSMLARAFGAQKTPEAFLFDKDGKLVYHGTIDDNHEDAAQAHKHYLNDALEAVVAGKPVPLPETKSMGCGIKFPKVS